MKRIFSQERLPYLVTALGPLLLFAPIFLQGRVLFWGTPMLQFVPWHRLSLETLMQGHLPLWNPLVGMGAPLAANYQSAIFYPANWLLALVTPEWGHGLLVMLHLIWAGWGMVLLARRLALEPLPAALAGIAFSMSGYMVARAWFISIPLTAAWLPWIVFATDRLAKAAAALDDRPALVRSVLLLGSLFGLQWLAGHAQTAWYTLLLAALWGLWRGAHAGGRKGFVRAAVAMAFAGVLGFALAAIQLLPTLEYLRESHRTTLDPNFALTYSFWPWRILGLLLPNLFGNPAHGDYWGYGNFWEDALYIGVLPFLFAVAALVRLMRRKTDARTPELFLASVVLVAFWFSLGRNTFLFRFLFSHVPTFNLFQAPSRWNLLSVFSLALLAGFGARYWRRPQGRALYWARLGTAGALGLALTALLGQSALPQVRVTFFRSFAELGLWLAAAGLLTLYLPDRDVPLRWILAAGLLLGDLVLAGSGLNPLASASVYQGRSHLATLAANGERLYLPEKLEYQLKFEQIYSFEGFATLEDWRDVRETGLPNAPMLDGIASANNFDPLLPGRYATWMKAMQRLSALDEERMLALMGVVWRGEGRGRSLVYLHVPGAARVRLLAEATYVSTPEEALAAVLDSDFNPDETLILEGEERKENGSPAGARFVVRDETNPNLVEIDVQSPGGTWLLLSDTWYPGWQARIDGAEQEVWRADYLFRAVWVPAGSHRVTFRYQPLSFTLGAALSLGAVLLMAFAWRRWRNDAR